MSKKMKVSVQLTRRDFLTLGATAVGSVLAAQVFTTGPLSPFSVLKQQQIEGETEAGGGHGATGEYHWGMVISLDKCIGCEYCLRACCATNDVQKTWPGTW